MVTASSGYPTQSWGAGNYRTRGYGWPSSDGAKEVESANQTVRNLIRTHGANLIKLPVTQPSQLGSPQQLSRAAMKAAVNQAHASGVKVGTHAMSAAAVGVAADVGIDVLVHTPGFHVDANAGLVRRWQGKAVVTTSGVFGTADVLTGWRRVQKSHNITIMYGTDFGNRQASFRITAPSYASPAPFSFLQGALLLCSGRVLQE